MAQFVAGIQFSHSLLCLVVSGISKFGGRILVTFLITIPAAGFGVMFIIFHDCAMVPSSKPRLRITDWFVVGVAVWTFIMPEAFPCHTPCHRRDSTAADWDVHHDREGVSRRTMV